MLPAVGHACPRAEWKEGRCPPPHLAALALEAAPGLRPWCLGVSHGGGGGGGRGGNQRKGDPDSLFREKEKPGLQVALSSGEGRGQG